MLDAVRAIRRTPARSLGIVLAHLCAACGLAAAVVVADARAAGPGTRGGGAKPFSEAFRGTRLENQRWLRRWGDVAVRANAVLLSSTPPLQAAETHSSLVTTRRAWRDFDLRLQLGAQRQLRSAQPPNPWETAWVMFRFRGLHDYYYFMLKPNGWELGKKQGSDAQIFLATGEAPRLAIGANARVRISVSGSAVTVFVNGTKIVHFVDSRPLPGGAVGLYEEDAVARFGDVTISPLAASTVGHVKGSGPSPDSP